MPGRRTSLNIVPQAKRLYGEAFRAFGEPKNVETGHVIVVRTGLQLLRYPSEVFARIGWRFSAVW